MQNRLFLGSGLVVSTKALRIILVTFAALVSVTALCEAFGWIDIPLALELGVGARMPQVFALHMASGGVGLALVLAALCVRPGSRAHRMFGRTAAVFVFLAGLTAIPVGAGSSAGLVARVSFVTQGALWLALLVVGLQAIRNRDRARHRAAMSLMSAAAFGAVLLRVQLALHAQLFPLSEFETAYGVMTWSSWLAPLVGTALYLRWRPSLRA